MEIRDLQFTVTESSLAQAAALPRTGERWFKNRSVENQEWKNMLKNPGMDTTIFTKGIPVSVIKEEWTALLLLVHKFFTCEGRFGIMYVYHAKIMMHFMGEHDINLPYFLLSSLRKMSTTVQRNMGNIEPHLYHHGLIKILIEEQLKTKKDTWEKFLIRNHFQEATEASGSSPRVPKRSRRRGREEVVIQETAPEIVVQELDVEETVQDLTVEETAAQNSKEEIDLEIAAEVDQTAQEIITETLQEIAQGAAQRTKKEGRKKQKQDKGKAIVQEAKKDKGKAIVQEAYLTPETSIEEDT